jgi:hypothetical protein
VDKHDDHIIDEEEANKQRTKGKENRTLNDSGDYPLQDMIFYGWASA